jgi:hypothetical protein
MNRHTSVGIDSQRGPIRIGHRRVDMYWLDREDRVKFIQPICVDGVRCIRTAGCGSKQ